MATSSLADSRAIPSYPFAFQNSALLDLLIAKTEVRCQQVAHLEPAMTEAEAGRVYVENLKKLIARIKNDPVPFQLRIYESEGLGTPSVTHPQLKVIRHVHKEDEDGIELSQPS